MPSANPDWFNPGITYLEPAISAERKALIYYQKDSSGNSLDTAQKAQKRCTTDCLAQHKRLPEHPISADCSNIHSIYDGMKKAFYPWITKIAHLKLAWGDFITDRGKQVERWAKHYKELYSNENTTSNAASVINNTLLIMKELDAPPSIIEQERAVQSLASGKAPGKGNIP